jgi:hypothetical protein
MGIRRTPKVKTEPQVFKENLVLETLKPLEPYNTRTDKLTLSTKRMQILGNIKQGFGKTGQLGSNINVKLGRNN